jgi:hypothetical protein
MAISGQKTIDVAGTAENLGSGRCSANLMIKALVTNTGLVFVGNSGADVTSANGQELDAGESLVLRNLARMEHIFLDAAINGDGVSWIMLNI